MGSLKRNIHSSKRVLQTVLHSDAYQPFLGIYSKGCHKINFFLVFIIELTLFHNKEPFDKQKCLLNVKGIVKHLYKSAQNYYRYILCIFLAYYTYELIRAKE